MIIGAAHRRTLRTTGAVVVSFYAAVMMLALACSFGEPAGGHDHHHHAGQSAHSALCIWACQANIGVALLSVPGDGRPTLMASEGAPMALDAPTLVSARVLHLRGPPLA
jgi:hypothetical protein